MQLNASNSCIRRRRVSNVSVNFSGSQAGSQVACMSSLPVDSERGFRASIFFCSLKLSFLSTSEESSLCLSVPLPSSSQYFQGVPSGTTNATEPEGQNLRPRSHTKFFTIFFTFFSLGSEKNLRSHRRRKKKSEGRHV